jgi:hypothetical protein
MGVSGARYFSQGFAATTYVEWGRGRVLGLQTKSAKVEMCTPPWAWGTTRSTSTRRSDFRLQATRYEHLFDIRS